MKFKNQMSFHCLCFILLSSGYSSVWYRCGNQLVKQARPWSKAGDCSAYTVTRDFTGDGLVTTLTTDNNSLKAVVFFKRM